MAITPGYTTSTEATEVEQEWRDKGAVMTPQVNPVVEAKYRAAEVEAKAKDFVEWPTKVQGQTEQGM